MMLTNIGANTILYEKMEGSILPPGSMYLREVSYQYASPLKVESITLTVGTTSKNPKMMAAELQYMLRASSQSHEFSYIHDELPRFMMQRGYPNNRLIGFKVRVFGTIPTTYLMKYKDEIQSIEIEGSRIGEEQRNHDFFSTAGLTYRHLHDGFSYFSRTQTYRIYSNIGILENELYIDKTLKTKVNEILFKPTNNKTAKRIAKLANIHD